MVPATFAWQMSDVANPYAAFLITGSATVLGLISIASGAPLLLLSLIGGVAADRLPRRKILTATQTALCLASAMLLVSHGLGQLQVWHLMLFGAIQGSAFAFNMPARQAFIADAVGRPLLRNAVALNNAGLNMARVAGPAVAGAILVVPALGLGGIYVGMVASYAFVLWVVLRIPPTPAADLPGGLRDPNKPRPGPLEELREGLAYVAKQRTVRLLLSMGFVVFFLGMPIQNLLPIFAVRVYGVDAAGLGALNSAMGIGALCGSFLVAGLTGLRRPTLVQTCFGLGFGLCLIAFALAPGFYPGLACIALDGFFNAGFAALNNTLLTSSTDQQLYGRVMSVYLLTFATSRTGILPQGWLADQLGGPTTVVIAGSLLIAAVVGFVTLSPGYRRIR